MAGACALTSCWLLASGSARAATWTVPGGFSSIQAALDEAVAGDTIEVSSGVYFEKIEFPRSGNSADGSIVLRAAAGQQPVLDGSGVAGANMVLIDGRSHVAIIGFEIRNNLGVDDGSGVRVLGAATNVEIRDNRIHDMRGQHAMGITVYGTEPAPIENLVIDGNEIHDCEPATSEALTLNGNVTDFAVTNNVVRDVNNIGIDFIGGETDIQPDPSKVARNGLCRGNQVLRANSSYGGGYAGGIYVDGGRDIVIENNLVSDCDLGIEIGAENAGLVTSGVVVRDNLVFGNQKAGIVFGGYGPQVGRASGNAFLHNTVYKNDTLGEGLGELWIQFAENNIVRNNIFYSTSQNVLLYSENGNVGNDLDYNLWYTDDGDSATTFVWRGTAYEGSTAYRAASGQDANSLFVDPQLVDAGTADFHLSPTSVAINAGDPAFTPAPGEVDLDGAPRVSGPRVDIGADEVTCGDGVVNPGEACDDGNQADGDGCDSNCTATGCGNGIVTAGETCDDGNVVVGDCCASDCTPESAGNPCDDGAACTSDDRCDGGGDCSGDVKPRPACRGPAVPGKASILIKAGTSSDRDRMGWKWLKGSATSLEELGDPTTSTGYALCVYDGVGAGSYSLLTAAVLAPALQCGGRPCWKAAGSNGYKYEDRLLVHGPVRGLFLRQGVDEKAKIVVKARGTGLSLGLLPPAQNPRLVVQLSADSGLCWESRFSSPAKRATSELFKDKED